MTKRSQAAYDLYERLRSEGEATECYLNPDVEFTLDIVEGLLANEERYSYWACPCRLAEGSRAQDLDIICPYDYRDADLDEYGACYCALYVSEEILEGKKQAHPVPERRGTEPDEQEHVEELVGMTTDGLPIWRCRVCGYLCARPKPPLKCPICKADRDRFERTSLHVAR